jgi:hypothetical protein
MKEVTPTYMGHDVSTGFWAFSPSPITDADYVWDISEWSFQNIMDFMNLPTDTEKFSYLYSIGLQDESWEHDECCQCGGIAWINDAGICSVCEEE